MMRSWDWAVIDSTRPALIVFGASTHVPVDCAPVFPVRAAFDIDPAEASLSTSPSYVLYMRGRSTVIVLGVADVVRDVLQSRSS